MSEFTPSQTQPGAGTFGYEYELLLPFTCQEQYDRICEPQGDKHAIARQPDLGFTLKVDQQAKLSAFKPQTYKRRETSPFGKLVPVPVAWKSDTMTIPEIVTDVLNAGMPLDEVRERIGKIAVWAQGTAAQAVAARKSLQQLDPALTAEPSTKETPATLFLGPITHPVDAEDDVRRAAQNALGALTVSAYIHETYAMPLCWVLREFGQLVGTAASKTTLFLPPLEAAAKAGPVNDALEALQRDLPARSAWATQDLGGYLALLRYYVAALADSQKSGLAKNNPGLLLFYKTDLAHLRSAVLKAHSELGPLFAPERKDKVALASMKLLGDLKATMRKYAGELLSGAAAHDSVFEGARNPWSDELYPAHGALGVVVENRRIAELQLSSSTERFPPSSWVGLAESLHKRLVAYWTTRP